MSSRVEVGEASASLQSEATVATLKRFYMLELHEHLHDTEVGMSLNDKHTLEIQQQTTYYLGDHYEVGLIWSHEAS